MSEHVISRRTYLIVFAALMVLLGATFVIDEFQPGRWGFAISIGIAAAKALLIGVYFMHLRFSSPLSRIIAVGGLLWLGIMLAFTLGDYGHRDADGGVGPERTPSREAVSRDGTGENRRIAARPLP